MTVYGMLASLAWSAVVGYAMWRGARLWTDIGQLEDATERERLASSERIARLSATPAQQKAADAVALGSIVIPDDLEAVAGQESEAWAQEDMRAMIREKFATLKDWQKVRRAVGIGELPEGAVHIL